MLYCQWLTIDRLISNLSQISSERFATVTVTAGHVPGEVNVFTDADNRNFLVENGKGPELRRVLNLLPRVPWPEGLMIAT